MVGKIVEPYRILAVFAHPDDELSVGSTLARYAASGVAITLVCATRGEAATIFSPPEYGATRENLAEVRTRELECCCQVLGIEDLRWLDWPDGAVAGLARDPAVAQVARIIRAVQPHVMVTHPDHGGYPHPDHLAIHDIVLAAWHAAADPAYLPDLGPAHAAAKLYGRVIPLSFFEKAPEFAQYRVQLNGEQLPFVATPDDEISTVIDVAGWADRRAAGWECHKSQHNPNGAFSQVPDDVERDYRSHEYLELMAHRLPGTPATETDLFAGIDVPEAVEADAGDAGAEQDLPAGKARAALAARLLEGLRISRTSLMLYEEYRKRGRQEDFTALLDRLSDDVQEVIAEMSLLLRRLDRSPMHAGVNEKVLAQGMARKGTASKLNFLLVGQARLADWAAEQVSRQDPPAVTVVWQHMGAMAVKHQEATKVLLGWVEESAKGEEGDE